MINENKYNTFLLPYSESLLYHHTHLVTFSTVSNHSYNFNSNQNDSRALDNHTKQIQWGEENINADEAMEIEDNMIQSNSNPIEYEEAKWVGLELEQCTMEFLGNTSKNEFDQDLKKKLKPMEKQKRTKNKKILITVKKPFDESQFKIYRYQAEIIHNKNNNKSDRDIDYYQEQFNMYLTKNGLDNMEELNQEEKAKKMEIAKLAFLEFSRLKQEEINRLVEEELERRIREKTVDGHISQEEEQKIWDDLSQQYNVLIPQAPPYINIQGLFDKQKKEQQRNYRISKGSTIEVIDGSLKSNLNLNENKDIDNPISDSNPLSDAENEAAEGSNKKIKGRHIKIKEGDTTLDYKTIEIEKLKKLNKSDVHSIHSEVNRTIRQQIEDEDIDHYIYNPNRRRMTFTKKNNVCCPYCRKDRSNAQSTLENIKNDDSKDKVNELENELSNCNPHNVNAETDNADNDNEDNDEETFKYYNNNNIITDSNEESDNDDNDNDDKENNRDNDNIYDSNSDEEYKSIHESDKDSETKRKEARAKKKEKEKEKEKKAKLNAKNKAKDRDKDKDKAVMNNKTTLFTPQKQTTSEIHKKKFNMKPQLKKQQQQQLHPQLKQGKIKHEGFVPNYHPQLNNNKNKEAVNNDNSNSNSNIANHTKMKKVIQSLHKQSNQNLIEDKMKLSPSMSQNQSITTRFKNQIDKGKVKGIVKGQLNKISSITPSTKNENWTSNISKKINYNNDIYSNNNNSTTQPIRIRNVSQESDLNLLNKKLNNINHDSNTNINKPSSSLNHYNNSNNMHKSNLTQRDWKKISKPQLSAASTMAPKSGTNFYKTKKIEYITNKDLNYGFECWKAENMKNSNFSTKNSRCNSGQQSNIIEEEEKRLKLVRRKTFSNLTDEEIERKKKRLINLMKDKSNPYSIYWADKFLNNACQMGMTFYKSINGVPILTGFRKKEETIDDTFKQIQQELHKQKQFEMSKYHNKSSLTFHPCLDSNHNRGNVELDPDKTGKCKVIEYPKIFKYFN